MEEEDTKPSNEVVLSKYTIGAAIVNTVLKELIDASRPDVSVRTLCHMGDNRMMQLLNATFKTNTNLKKGISFPTCVSIDHCVCHFSPLECEETLKNGQMVKFDIGVHLDGYISGGAHTIVVGATKENPITGSKANVITAAYNSMELALRMLRPEKGFSNMDVAEKIAQLCKVYDVTPMEDVTSHQVERFNVAGKKKIIINDKTRVIEKCTFENYEVYSIDVLVSTGVGHYRELLVRTTIYKWNNILADQLENKFCGMPFHIRHIDREEHLDIVKCSHLGFLDAYPSIFEDEEAFVAQFRTTAIITPTGIMKLTGLPLDTSVLDCNVRITDTELSSLLQESLKPKKKKKPAKKANAEKQTTSEGKTASEENAASEGKTESERQTTSEGKTASEEKVTTEENVTTEGKAASEKQATSEDETTSTQAEIKNDDMKEVKTND